MKRTAAVFFVMITVLMLFPAQAASGRIFLLTEGETLDLSSNFGSRSVSLTSADTAVASVSGVNVKARNAGRSILTAKSGGKSVRFGLIVLPESIELNAGKCYTLPGGSYTRYGVRDTNIVKVGKNGIVKALREGETLIDVRAGNEDRFVKVTVSGSAAAKQSRAADLPAAATTSRIVLVEHTSGSNATLSLHEKKNGVWKEIGSCAAYVGKNGIGKTKEGDGKTPTGTFDLTTPFGILSDPGAAQSYTKVNSHLYWCGTSSSEYYNKPVDDRKASWKRSSSDEHLIDYKGSYDYAMFITYNAAGEKGKGSCIFLHCKGKGRSTAGCVAVDKAVMKNILKWAAKGTKIVITEKA